MIFINVSMQDIVISGRRNAKQLFRKLDQSASKSQIRALGKVRKMVPRRASMMTFAMSQGK